jgi:hypothetical protein
MRNTLHQPTTAQFHAVLMTLLFLGMATMLTLLLARPVHGF